MEGHESGRLEGSNPSLAQELVETAQPGMLARPMAERVSERLGTFRRFDASEFGH
jgi:hypothetical protein